MIILASFVANVLRATKDALVIPLMGAEVISTLKLYAVVPAALIFIIFYSKISNILHRDKVFTAVIGFFLAFLLIFNFFLYPNANSLQADFSDISAKYPAFKWPLLVVGNWIFSLFYVIADMCGNIMIYVLFFRLANEINTVDEAKKYYAFFIMIGHLGHISSGLTVSFVSSSFINSAQAHGQESWDEAMRIFILIVSAALILKIFLHNWILKNVTRPSRALAEQAESMEKPKISLMQSLKLVFSSKYIGLIAAMIMCYGVSINIVESVWKSQVRIEYPTNNEYNFFMGQIQTYGGMFYIIVAFFALIIIRKFSWRFCALILPVVIFITGFLFFALTIFQGTMDQLLLYFSVSSCALAVFVGAMQNVLSKSVKYAIFDTTKEMAYIPLDENLKTQGKAASDLLGHKIGKSGGAFIQWLLLTIIPDSTLLSLSQYFFVIFIIVGILWFYTVFELDKEFRARLQSDL